MKPVAARSLKRKLQCQQGPRPRPCQGPHGTGSWAARLQLRGRLLRVGGRPQHGRHGRARRRRRVRALGLLGLARVAPRRQPGALRRPAGRHRGGLAQPLHLGLRCLLARRRGPQRVRRRRHGDCRRREARRHRWLQPHVRVGRQLRPGTPPARQPRRRSLDSLSRQRSRVGTAPALHVRAEARRAYSLSQAILTALSNNHYMGCSSACSFAM